MRFNYLRRREFITSSARRAAAARRARTAAGDAGDRVSRQHCGARIATPVAVFRQGLRKAAIESQNGDRVSMGGQSK
jgi:hypothetical protein